MRALLGFPRFLVHSQENLFQLTSAWASAEQMAACSKGGCITNILLTPPCLHMAASPYAWPLNGHQYIALAAHCTHSFANRHVCHLGCAVGVGRGAVALRSGLPFAPSTGQGMLPQEGDVPLLSPERSNQAKRSGCQQLARLCSTGSRGEGFGVGICEACASRGGSACRQGSKEM
jgi:hypothetical protein